MKAKIIFGWLVCFIAALAGTPTLYAGPDAQEVFVGDDTGASDPSAFEGDAEADAESLEGGRAPEEMPMDDSPVDAGIGIQ